MYKVSITYKREKEILPLYENIECERFEREGNWIEFETKDGELIIVSAHNVIRISIVRCQTE